MNELPIAYDTGVLAQRAAGERGRVVFSSLSTGVTVVFLIGVLLYVWLERQGQFGEVFWMLTWILAISAATGIAILVARIVWLTLLRRGLRAVGDGLALVVSSWGIQSEAGHAAWTEIARVAAVKGKPGRGYGLRVERVDGSVLEFPLEGLGVLPGTLDAAVRAYSAGRHGVDLSVIDD